MTFLASVIRVPPVYGKQLVTAWKGGVSSIGMLPVAASFAVVRTMKGLIFIGPEGQRVFRGGFLRRNSSPSFTS